MPEWRKSSFSQDGAECLELTWLSGQAFVRDSKNRSVLPVPVDLSALVSSVKAGRFER